VKVQAPKSVSRGYTQHLCAPPEEVFPLQCPVRETEWVNDWRPSLVLSNSGVAEPDCVFITPGVPEDALWVITLHDPIGFRLEMLKLVPGVVVGKISIGLAPEGERGCTADISYAYTSLGAYGDRMVEEFTEEHFRSYMKVWEKELNHFLLTGTRLEKCGTG